MNDIKQLEERIAQLTELVNAGTETLESLKETLKTVEKERDRFADQRREQEPRFERVELGQDYYYVASYPEGLKVCKELEDHTNADNRFYGSNNYFHTEERAQEVIDKINLLLKLERLHDTFCPDYKPNWNDGENKYFVFYDNNSKRYEFNAVAIVEYEPIVYYPTRGIAQKVCDILNEELEEF